MPIDRRRRSSIGRAWPDRRDNRSRLPFPRCRVPEGAVASDGRRGLTRGSPMSTVRLILALHNHQPVGNFDGVFEAAYRDSYLPFLDVLEDYPEIPFVLHTSGPLLEWLVERQPEYIDRVRGAGRGGAGRDPRRRVLRADPDDDPPPRPGRADPRLLGLSRGALRRQGPRHVDARAGLGAAPGLGDRRGGHRVHGPRRLPLPARRASPATSSSATT